MPKYEIKKVEFATVQARNEKEAVEMANIEFMNYPEASYSVECLTPPNRLIEIADELNGLGFATYLDEWKNNSAPILRIDLTESDEMRYALYMELNDEEEFTGNGYTLGADAQTGDEKQVQEIRAKIMTTETPRQVGFIAGEIGEAIRSFEITNPRETAPVEMNASMEEIAELLTRMGFKAGVESQAWRGMPSYLNIGETVDFYADGTPCYAPEFTLYYDLNENGDAISGTGFHLSRGDDEGDHLAYIGNVSAYRVVAEIVASIAKEGVTK